MHKRTKSIAEGLTRSSDLDIIVVVDGAIEAAERLES